MRAASNTLASTYSLCSTHNSFKRAATGSQSVRDMGFVRGQYACTPLPELIRIGSGNPIWLQNPAKA